MKAPLRIMLFILTLVFSLGSTAAQVKASHSLTNLERIQQTKVLRVGVSSFVPWVMRDKHGKLVGFEIDVAQKLAADYGWQIRLVPTAWDGILASLIAKKIDVAISGISITPERQKHVSFSIPYSHSGIQIAAHKQLASKLTTLQKINSRRVRIAVRRGATTVTAARRYFPKAQLLQFDDDAQAFQEVLNGNAHLVMATSPKPEFETIKHADRLFMPFKKALAEGSEGFAMPLNDTQMKAFFDKWIKKNQAWINSRHDYWFKSMDWQKQLTK